MAHLPSMQSGSEKRMQVAPSSWCYLFLTCVGKGTPTANKKSKSVTTMHPPTRSQPFRAPPAGTRQPLEQTNTFPPRVRSEPSRAPLNTNCQSPQQLVHFLLCPLEWPQGCMHPDGNGQGHASCFEIDKINAASGRHTQARCQIRTMPETNHAFRTMPAASRAKAIVRVPAHAKLLKSTHA